MKTLMTALLFTLTYSLNFNAHAQPANTQNVDFALQCSKTYDSGTAYYFMYSIGGNVTIFKRGRGLATEIGGTDNTITARTLTQIQKTNSIYSYKTTKRSDGPIRGDDNEQWDLARDTLVLTLASTLGGNYGGTYLHQFSCQKLSDANTSYSAVKKLFDAEQRSKKQREDNQTQQQLKKNQL